MEPISAPQSRALGTSTATASQSWLSDYHGHRIWGISDVGAVAVYYGTPTTFTARSAAWLQGSGQEEFGTAIVGGDTDSDGWADVVVGANRGDFVRLRAGRAAVFRGGRGALSTATVRTFLGSDTDALASALAM
jgi:hypothetical protein